MGATREGRVDRSDRRGRLLAMGLASSWATCVVIVNSWEAMPTLLGEDGHTVGNRLFSLSILPLTAKGSFRECS